MNFNEIIEKVNSDKRLKPDLMKAENGNNFRAISESAILDVVDPVLKEAGWYYTVELKNQQLEIREAFGKTGKKLQFIATLALRVVFTNGPQLVFMDSVGMGIDDNDKAMGKAYTYAIKYALLKIFRLRYGDDPDFEASKPLTLEKPVEKKKEETPKKNEKTSQFMSENQRDYILGLMKEKGVSESLIISQFGYEPSMDDKIPMKTARAIIEYLQKYEDLPF